MNSPTATLLLSCPDQRGLVAKFANFIYENGGNIIDADQHTDFEAGLFLTRIEWQLEGFRLSRDKIASYFDAIAEPLQAVWEIHFSDTIPRLALFVTKQNHCLLDLLWRWKAKEIRGDIPLIISNHENLREIAEQFNIDFHHIAITKETKQEEASQKVWGDSPKVRGQ
ncbi:ACT domain-containing protein, partial [Crocosphaera sp. Alani8]|uniref:ACT domain-containing protein n=1 Tax=Crocosphaera sp. Alani8 TaxID=3038952 RepID=UPI00313AC3AD